MIGEAYNQKNFQYYLDEVLGELRTLLLEKNRKYGNSALEPARVFSKASPKEQLLVRMDDKISRIVSGQSDDLEDVFTDLQGYLVIYKIAEKMEADAKAQ